MKMSERRFYETILELAHRRGQLVSQAHAAREKLERLGIEER